MEWGPAVTLSHLGGGASHPPVSGQKADKSALATKVSRVQFDATTEQLNHMMQELVAKMTGQEQDWQKMLDKLLVEMDNKVTGAAPPPPSTADPHLLSQSSPGARPPASSPKLDRLELDPVKQSLEDRWKSLRQQLKERSPLYQADEAAAMRRRGPAGARMGRLEGPHVCLEGLADPVWDCPAVGRDGT